MRSPVTRPGLLALLLLLPRGVSAQEQGFSSGELGAAPEEGTEDAPIVDREGRVVLERAVLSDGEGPIAGPCGELIRRHAVIVSDEVDGRAFRGVGAPARGTELQLDVWGGAIPVSSPDVGFVGEATIRTVLLQLYRRTCLTGQVRVPVPFGSLGPYLLGNPTTELGLLVRTPLDGLRFELGLTLAFPSVGEHVENALALQTGYHAALLSGNHDELGWLPMLEWGGKMRGRLRLQTTAGPLTGHLGVIGDLTLNLGFARLSSALGPREGLVGGVRFLLGAHWRPPLETDSRGVSWGRYTSAANLLVAGEVRLGFGSLWPTDVLLPVYAGGRVEVGVAWPELGNPEIAITAGGVFPQLVLDASECYFQMGLSLVFGIDDSPGRRGISSEAPRTAPPDSVFAAPRARDAGPSAPPPEPEPRAGDVVPPAETSVDDADAPARVGDSVPEPTEDADAPVGDSVSEPTENRSRKRR